MRQPRGFVAWLFRLGVAAVPPARRPWAEAIWAEAVAAPHEARRWLTGGLWFIVREAQMVRSAGYGVVGLGAGGALVWLGWHPGSENPAAPVDRIALGMVVALLVGLPWATRRWLGPVATNPTARLVRAGGFVAMFALLGVVVGLSRFAGSRFDHFRAFDQATWSAEMRTGAAVGGLVIVALTGGYALAILLVTSARRSVPPRSLGVGVLLGVVTAVALYALMPLGNPRHVGSPALSAALALAALLVPAAALLAAGYWGGRQSFAGGVTAGLCAGATAAVLVTVLTVGTMLLFPGSVDLIWANPDPLAPHGTAYELQMTLSDTAGKYQLALLFGPLVGLALGAVAAGSSRAVPALDPARG